MEANKKMLSSQIEFIASEEEKFEKKVQKLIYKRDLLNAEIAMCNEKSTKLTELRHSLIDKLIQTNTP